MSTRGFFTIVVDGQEKTVFNHFDSYPSGLGMVVLRWLRWQAQPSGDLAAAEQQARGLRVFSAKDAPLTAVRDLGCDIRDLMRRSELVDDSKFPLDSLFCEWGYVVDFDNQVLEAYRGFQLRPHSIGRFGSRLPEGKKAAIGDVFYPVKLVGSWPLSDLPDNDQFDAWQVDVEEEAEKEAESLLSLSQREVNGDDRRGT